MTVLDAVLPERLGRDFRWLWSSFTIANLGDGILLSAGPLLVTSITLQPLAVAFAVFAQRLPWLLFGVVAGAIIDRVDRRKLMMAVDGLRAVVLALLTLGIALDLLSLPLIYAVMFLIGVAETFADNASSTLVAVTVPSPSLGLANARLMGANVVTNQLAGPPIGAILFGLGRALPFGVNVVCFAAAVVLVRKMRIDDTGIDPGVENPARNLRREVAEGVRWLWAHRAVRTLAILITVFNVTFGAAFSIWVLYAFERLGLDGTGFGLLLGASAVGGIAGSALFGRLEMRFSYATLLRVGLVVETLTHLGLALTTTPLVAGGIMMLFGVHAVTWGSLSNTIRHRAIPSALLGRVTSVYMIGSVGAIALGTLLGGVLAERWGVLAPFWFAFGGAAITTAIVWRSIENIAQAGEPPAGDEGAMAPQPIAPPDRI